MLSNSTLFKLARYFRKIKILTVILLTIKVDDEHKRQLKKCHTTIYTFDLPDQCQDKLCEILEYKSKDAKKELQVQAAARGEELKADILYFSSRVAKARLSAQVHRRYDFCMTCNDIGGEGGEAEKVRE
jgi:hypothetical protein